MTNVSVKHIHKTNEFSIKLSIKGKVNMVVVYKQRIPTCIGY